MTGDQAASAASQPSSRTLSPVWRWTGAGFFALAISTTRSLTLPATVLVVAGGLGVWLTARYAPPTPQPGAAPVPRMGVAAWAGVFLAFCLWELGAFLIGNNDAHPTFSMLTEPILAWGPARALAGFGWLAWGWYLLSR